MIKKRPNLGFGSQMNYSGKSANVAESEDSKSSLKESEVLKTITLNVDNIENIDESKTKEIIVRMEFMGEVLGQSLQIPVVKNAGDIALTATINATNISPQFLDNLLSNPILFTILDCTRPTTDSPSVGNLTPSVETKRKTSLSPSTLSKSTSCNVIGVCNLEIGNLALGETVIKKTLFVEPYVKGQEYEPSTWPKLPRISVGASVEESLISDIDFRSNNTLGITIESVYNIPEYLLNGSVFEASLPLPIVGERTGKLRFPNGVVINKDDFPYRKKWLCFSQTEDAGVRTAHRISYTYWDVYSSLSHNSNVQRLVQNSRRVIRWNVWKNCLMIKNDANYFYTKLMKYRLWPIEILLTYKAKEKDPPKEKGAKTERKSKPALSIYPSSPDHFMAFLDLSPLLHPGVTKVRVAAQLLTYSHSELVNKFGQEFLSEFGLFTQSTQSITRIKNGSAKSRTSTRENEDIVDTPALPVFDETNSPTFIIVEVELFRPFVAKKKIETLEYDLKSHLCLKEKFKPKTTTFGLMKENFSRSLLNMMTILSEEYEKYRTGCCKKISVYGDISTEFQKYLYTQENFYRIKATLERTVIELIKEKYGTVRNYEAKIPEIYVYLVNEMHRVTNACLLGQNDVSSRSFYNDHLQLYAEEAIEEGDFDLARQYLFLKLSRNTASPDYWLDYAVFCVRTNNAEEAIEAVREALSLDFHHQIGLLMYALLMAKFFNYTLAETTCEILLTKYPNFIEGWMALSLIYSVFNNFEGAEVAMQEAVKAGCYDITKAKPEASSGSEDNEFIFKVHGCKNNLAKVIKYGVGSLKSGSNCVEPLSWTILFAPPENIYLKTTILLLKLGFYEFAALSLSEELIRGSKEGKASPHYVYYSSVNYYLQGRSEEAIPILQEIVKEYGKDCYVWSLLGHCYYKLSNHAKAINCYEYVNEAYNRPNDIHLVYLRIGLYYLQAHKFHCAKHVLMNACKFSPTPKAWKGVGIASLELGELEDAEIAFSEANYLDSKDPEIWAYLALTNAFLQRLSLFQQCYIEAKKRNLKNLELIKKLESCVTVHNLNNLVV